MAETRDYTKLVPFQPPEGLLSWAMENTPALQKNIMVYKVKWVTDPVTGLKSRAVEGWCSACGATDIFGYYAGTAYDPGFMQYEAGSNSPKKIRNGKECTCEECGRKLNAIHCGAFKSVYHLGTGWPMTVGRVEDRLVLTGWYIQREVCKYGGSYRVETMLRPYEAYVVEPRKLVRLKAYTRFLSAVTFLSGWTQTKRCSDEWGETEQIYPWDARIVEGSTAENSALAKYLQAEGSRRPVSYLRLWKQHKNVENLVMQGAGGLLNSLMEGALYADGYYGKARVSTWAIKGVNWKENRPAKMLGLNKDEFRRAVRLKLDRYGLQMVVRLKQLGKTLKTDEETEICAKFGPLGVISMAEDKLPVLKTVRYLNRQMEKYPGENKKIALSTLEDYWDMARKAGDDMNDPKVLWPQHLTAQHDAVMLRTKWEEKQAWKEDFRRVGERLEPLRFEADGFVIFPCPNQSDLIREGKILDHCVARYANTHKDGKQCIFFLRKAEAPEIPFYTLELDVDSRTVLQNRGKRNCAETKDVVRFRSQWVEYIKTVRLEGEGRSKERKAS